MKITRLANAALITCALVTLSSAQVTLSGTTYTQNFNSIGSGLPSGWSVYTGASASSLGSSASLTVAATSWGDTVGAFKNVASTAGLTSSSTSANQSASSDRALGVRTGSSFGDPGASFAFNFNSTGYNITSISLDALMLSIQTRSQVWTVDYGIGSNPSSFTSTGFTYSDSGTWGSTSLSITGSALAALSNQSNAWIRFVALSASTGSGSRDTIGIDNFSITTTAVPEPSTYALILGGIALVSVMVMRRRQRKVAA